MELKAVVEELKWQFYSMNRKGKSGSVFSCIFVVDFLYASETGRNNLFVQLKKFMNQNSFVC